MIPYILIALISLFIAFCCGCAAGYSTGYKAAFAEMLPIVKELEHIVTVMGAKKHGNTIDASSERGDKETP